MMIPLKFIFYCERLNIRTKLFTGCVLLCSFPHCHNSLLRYTASFICHIGSCSLFSHVNLISQLLGQFTIPAFRRSDRSKEKLKKNKSLYIHIKYIVSTFDLHFPQSFHILLIISSSFPFFINHLQSRA